MSNGRSYTPEYKAKITIEMLGEQKTLAQISAREGISPKLLGNWKKEFSQNAYRAFSVTKDEKAAQNIVKEYEEREQELMAQIGRLTYECEWLKKKSARISGAGKS